MRYEIESSVSLERGSQVLSSVTNDQIRQAMVAAMDEAGVSGVLRYVGDEPNVFRTSDAHGVSEIFATWNVETKTTGNHQAAVERLRQTVQAHLQRITDRAHAQSGMGTGTLLLIAAGVVTAGYLLLRRR